MPGEGREAIRPRPGTASNLFHTFRNTVSKKEEKKKTATETRNKQEKKKRKKKRKIERNVQCFTIRGMYTHTTYRSNGSAARSTSSGRTNRAATSQYVGLRRGLSSRCSSRYDRILPMRISYSCVSDSSADDDDAGR